MSKNLVIVESPAKAKTIKKFLGGDYTVMSSVGHIRDIPTKKGKDGKPPVDIEHNFAPTYEVDPEKKKLISELKKAAKAAETVYLATDEDREGEAIAWHLAEVLKLDAKKTPRIVFHEITKPAIEHALESPRTIDFNLVNAQQARRILDRLVGFELSPVVQRKVPGGRSAGRVQSPAVRLIVEREREIEDFQAEISFKITGQFTVPSGETVSGELKQRFATEAEAQAFLEKIKDTTFTVSDVVKAPGTRNPAAPFTTSTLQQEAAARLGFSVKATMSAAQKLYQDGKITYMRTDSVNLSSVALGAMTGYIKNTYGDEYHQYRTYKTKSASAQEAHEAIRPTDASLERASDDPYEQRLYELIRKRTLATQMAAAKMERTTATITISGAKEVFEAKGEVIVFDGFLRVYDYAKREDSILPPLASGQTLSLAEAVAQQLFSRPPARYSEGSLVKKLEELSIGRPSTYATIISTIQNRGYVVRGEGEGVERPTVRLVLKNGAVTRDTITEKTGADKGKLVPTPSGAVVNDFLTKHFNTVVDYNFTANVEEEFDEIARGKMVWHAMLAGFYGPFHKLIEAAGVISRAESSQARELGADPKSGKPIIARFGRYGPMLQRGATEDEEKPEFAPLPAGTTLTSVTLEQALEMFKLPRLVGKTEQGDDIKANIGRFGPYIQIGKTYVSIKPLDPHTITEPEARELYAAKLEKDAKRFINGFPGGIQVLNGPYGPYVTDGKKNARLPKDAKPEALTEDDCKKLLEAAPAKRRGGFRRKRASK
ncbi:MAG TPA: type I DNA topoisomerase [Candidatus Saccharimonadales bacterium]|nr:type I DNA topoisomerase [Candidatus Saccharimonadales bacterium]